jgi:signal transduction histidine kinase
LAEAQGGTITYADRNGGGAIFELRLPAATPQY